MPRSLDKIHPTTRYAAEVVSGLRGPIGHREWQACERHLKDIERRGTKAFPYVFDESRADPSSTGLKNAAAIRAVSFPDSS
jgi:hypothetical protein